ncbi:hypothetical protein RvVAR031_pl00870 (plasmid) [Agrobacterium vitis]|nr:hypothetical protein RvVAR031_pl00870 [Agrobacterium vitis]
MAKDAGQRHVDHSVALAENTQGKVQTWVSSQWHSTASFTKDPIWAQISAHIRDQAVNMQSAEWQWV